MRNGYRVKIVKKSSKFYGKIGHVGFISEDSLNGGKKAEIYLEDGPIIISNFKNIALVSENSV